VLELEVDMNDQVKLRKEKLDKLRELGNPFPNDFRRSHLSLELHQAFGDKDNTELEALNIEVSVAGRMMIRRLMGKASFVNLQDMAGRIQLYVKEEELGQGYEDFKSWDLGDILGAKGRLFKTKTGELSLKVTEVKLLTKSLQPLPDKWHGLQDQELRYRQRYVDLIANEDTRKVFILRSKIVQYIREFLAAKGFLEVETPMMHVIPGGAAARPFTTHHNALDMQLYLRVAPELYLKRLVVGGFEKVFELNRNFRNEGVSTRHNPEFTMIEFYQAYADYNDLMDLTEELLKGLTETVLGTSLVNYQGTSFDFGQPFRRLGLNTAILEFNPDLNSQQLNDLAVLKSYMQQKGFHLEEHWGLGKCQFALFEETVESNLQQPTFITEYPTEVSPLARRNDHNPDVTDRFEFFVGGRELANGFSELNDAYDQAERFKEQVANHESGDEEAMHYDADYIQALEYGLPPTAGEGIGIDRLVMLLTDSASIRDVLLFPHMRRQG